MNRAATEPAPPSSGVYFDDFKVTVTPTAVVQSNEYYPFGLQTANSWTRDNTTNNFLYDAGNELNTTTGVYDTPFRGYDPALGRFMQIDPLAHTSSDNTPYHYANNNPIKFNDPSGAVVPYYANPEDDPRNYRMTIHNDNAYVDFGYGGPIGGGSWSDDHTGAVEYRAQADFWSAVWSAFGSTTDTGEGTEGVQIYGRNEQTGQYGFWLSGSSFSYTNYLSYSGDEFSKDGVSTRLHEQVVSSTRDRFIPYDFSSGDGRGSATSFSFGFSFIFGISGEWGVVSDSYGNSKGYYTVSANFGLGLDIGFNKKEIIPTNGNKFTVDQYEGRGKNLSYGVLFTSESRGGNTPNNPTLDPTDFGGLYKERSNSYSPFLGLPNSFGLGDVGIIYQMSNTSFFK